MPQKVVDVVAFICFCFFKLITHAIFYFFKINGKLYNQIKVTCISLVDQIKKNYPTPSPPLPYPHFMHLIFRQKLFNNVSLLKCVNIKTSNERFIMDKIYRLIGPPPPPPWKQNQNWRIEYFNLYTFSVCTSVCFQ